VEKEGKGKEEGRNKKDCVMEVGAKELRNKVKEGKRGKRYFQAWWQKSLV